MCVGENRGYVVEFIAHFMEIGGRGLTAENLAILQSMMYNKDSLNRVPNYKLWNLCGNGNWLYYP